LTTIRIEKKLDTMLVGKGADGDNIEAAKLQKFFNNL